MNEHGSTTRRRLELALRRLQHGRMQSSSTERISIAGVAREAGVSNATIHNRYPDIAERVRALQSKAGKRSTKALPDTTDILQRKLAEAHEEIDRLKADLVRSQSINLRLIREYELLQASLQGRK